jgi:hypothetical protein
MQWDNEPMDSRLKILMIDYRFIPEKLRQLGQHAGEDQRR